MFRYFQHPDFSDADSALLDANPVAAVMIVALRDCHHPRTGLLLARLRHASDPDELALLRTEVFQTLALSFGVNEACARLRAKPLAPGANAKPLQ